MMSSNFYYMVLAGFIAAGGYRYIVHESWSMAHFIKVDLRNFAKSALVTAVAGYFAHDICALLPEHLAGADLNPCGTLATSPRLAGFFIGALGGTTDLLLVGRNLLSLVPVIGPKILLIFSRKPAQPQQ